MSSNARAIVLIDILVAQSSHIETLAGSFPTKRGIMFKKDAVVSNRHSRQVRSLGK
jgi:hypothetical protein